MLFVFTFSLSVKSLQFFRDERFVNLGSQFDCLGGAVQVEKAGKDVLQGTLLLVGGGLAGRGRPRWSPLPSLPQSGPDLVVGLQSQGGAEKSFLCIIFAFLLLLL